MPERRTELVHDGTWPPVLAWLDELAGGRMRIPLYHRPPITITPSGALRIENRAGVHYAYTGDTVYVDTATGEFHARLPRGPG